MLYFLLFFFGFRVCGSPVIRILFNNSEPSEKHEKWRHFGELYVNDSFNLGFGGEESIEKIISIGFNKNEKNHYWHQ
ncbi:hypothetical protein QTN25_006269 [Entamoeba marina]